MKAIPREKQGSVLDMTYGNFNGYLLWSIQFSVKTLTKDTPIILACLYPFLSTYVFLELIE